MTDQPTIKLLSPEQATKIAAGEVIERPANIAKELIENSLDAQATHIVIHLERAGKQRFTITDNGIGMSATDIKLCVLDHATSKISSVEDLQNIATFGFRGEALASVNAVSYVSITSKRAVDQVATQLDFNYGVCAGEQETAHQTGTTITITNLFGNIPARQKFLKQDDTEYRAIVHIFKAFCLQYPSVHFQLYHNHELQFNCPAVPLQKERFAQLWDSNLYQHTIELPRTTNELCSLSGVITDPSYQRYDRNQIFIFVNNRLVKNNDITKALLKSYLGVLPPQKFPAASLHITVPADTIDVNIHPKKEEVKFLHPHKIEQFITKEITKTLTQQAFATIEHTSASIPQTKDVFASYTAPLAAPLFSEQKSTQFNSIFTRNVTPHATYAPVPKIQQQDQTTSIVQAHHEQSQQQTIEVDEHITIIGQYMQTYIMLERSQGLLLIDQHAAHERILYERMKKNFTNIATIQLMFPELIKLTPSDVACAYEHETLLKQHGIIFESFSDDEIMVQAMPVHFKNQNIKELVKQAIALLHELGTHDSTRFHELFHEKMHTNIACKTAIKAGDILSMQQMETLIQELLRTENRFCCPHGRPTSHLISLDEITKKFKRDYTEKAEKHFDNFL